MNPSKSLGLCPRCDSSRRERGHLFRKGTLEQMKYRADNVAPLSYKKDVEAVLCQKCGYIELYVADHDLEKPDMWESTARTPHRK